MHGQNDSSRLISDLVALNGAGMEIVNLPDLQNVTQDRARGVVRIGVHREGSLPCEDLSGFDVLLSTDLGAPRPWVGVSSIQLEPTLAALQLSINRQPVASSITAQILRATEQMSFEHALVLESLGYSVLLASKGFRAWRSVTPVRKRIDDDAPRVLSSRQDNTLRIRLSRANVRNAFDARMRDELVAALEVAKFDTETSVELTAEGNTFCAGGDLNEFGSAEDAGTAHLIRILRSPCWLIHQLGSRIIIRLQGACVGAGIEIAAAAASVTACSGAHFRLPELSMGLLPGAGGTASIAGRIGRERTCYMAISGADIDLRTALAWGLVDAVEAVS